MLSKIVIFLVMLATTTIKANPRIVNGTNAKQSEFPYAVSLRYNASHTCGGTILSNVYILTAAHCVCSDANEPRNASLYSIQYGVTEITEDDTNVIQVAAIRCHDFDKLNLKYDVALLKLESAIPDDNCQAVKLSREFIAEKHKSGTIIGWGRIYQNGPISKSFKKLEVDIYDEETCGVKYDNDHHICFGAPVGGACNGDSGGALVVDNIQVGIASFITNICGVANKESPNVYSKVSNYYDWIVKNAEL